MPVGYIEASWVVPRGFFVPKSTIVPEIVPKTFSLADVDFSRVKNSKELVDIFIEFENDTILFYEMLKTFLVDEKTIEHLEKIIQEEASHIQKIDELRRSNSSHSEKAV